MKTLLTLFLIVFVLSGCGSKNNQNNTTENQTNSKSDANNTSEQIKSDTTNNSQGNTGSSSNDLGMKTGIPADFPADVPQPKNGKVIGSLTSSEGTMVTFQTDVPVKELIEFYKSELQKNGFTLSDGGETLIQENGGIIGFVKDKRDVGLMLSSDNGITSLVITYK